VAERVLEQVEGLTAGQVKTLVRRLAVEANPDDAKQRCERAVADRRVTAELTEDGTGTIVAWDLPAEQVAFVMNRIDVIAHDLNCRDEERSIDQLRADVFVDLLAGQVSTRQARIDITVDVETLAGLADRAGHLAGMGPIIGDIVRDVATTYGPQWRYAVVQPDSGDVLVAGTSRRRPSAAIRRTVELRDRTCVFPGCRMPARRSDLDHTTPYSEQATTDVESLAACCRHDHVIRPRVKWSYTRNPDRSYTWTAPSGIQYTRPPPT
jgi:hypothetical protein